MRLGKFVGMEASAATDDAGGADPATEPLRVDRHYLGYEDWKGWSRLFEVSDEEAEYFRGETRGIALTGKALLEIGFGSGSFLAWATAEGANVCGVEVNPALVEAAKLRGVDVLDAKLEAIAPYNRERFDVIVALDVFEHLVLDELEATLRAVEAMLRPGGHLILRFPNGQSPFGLQPQNGDITHRTALSKAKIEQLCLGRGLQAVRYGGSYRIRGSAGSRRATRALRGLARDLLGWLLNRIYSFDIPWDPVVVLVMRKDG